MTSARLIPSCRADSRSSGLHTNQTQLASFSPNRHFFSQRSDGILLVSNDAEVDGGVPVLLDGSQKSGAVRVSDLPRMEIILWIQQLNTNNMKPKEAPKRLVCLIPFLRLYLVSSGHDGHHGELVHADLRHSHRGQ